MRCFFAAAADRRGALLAGLLVGPALALRLWPRAGEALIYDRTAILAGELWRLLTGHWVHFSNTHLFWDGTVVAATAWIGTRRGYRRLPLLFLAAPPAIGLGILTFLPDLERFGGLSGVAMAATVFVAARGLREPRPWRDACAWALFATLVKLGVETASGAAPFVDFADAGVEPVPLSHALGAAVGVLAAAWTGWRPRATRAS